MLKNISNMDYYFVENIFENFENNSTTMKIITIIFIIVITILFISIIKLLSSSENRNTKSDNDFYCELFNLNKNFGYSVLINGIVQNGNINFQNYLRENIFVSPSKKQICILDK